MAGNAFAIAGVSSIVINGSTFDCKQEATINPTTLKREYVPNWSGTYPYIETPIPGKMTATLLSDGSFTQSSLIGLAGIPVIVQTVTGYTVTLNNAVCTEVGDFDIKDGSFSITFESANIIEVTA